MTELERLEKAINLFDAGKEMTLSSIAEQLGLAETNPLQPRIKTFLNGLSLTRQAARLTDVQWHLIVTKDGRPQSGRFKKPHITGAPKWPKA